MADLIMTKGKIPNLVIAHTTNKVTKHTTVVTFHFIKLANLLKSTGTSLISCTKNTILPTLVNLL